MRNQRKQPPVPPPDVTPVQKENVITQVREYQLITPLFGGGVAPGECDPVTVIRGTEIRGQLRFWWRATRGSQFTDIKALKKEEDKIWGAPYKKGEKGVSHEETVQITVEIINSGTPVKPFEIVKDKRGRNQPKWVRESKVPAYSAFPLQPSQDELKLPKLSLKAVQANVSFKLTITFPASRKEDIEAALWSWETFGGVGARTRRGFGALRLLAVDGQTNVDLPDAGNARKWVTEKLRHFTSEKETPPNTPYLSRNTQFKIVDRHSNELDTWGWLISKLQSFRQARYDSSFGRSKWPEADTIRYLTGQESTRPAVPKFPRAALGLPINFHFMKGDPRDVTLQGAVKEFERLASPLILRPLSCKNNQFVGLALVLKGPRIPPEGVQLITKNRQPRSVDTTLTKAEASEIPVLNGLTDVLQAFMDTLS